MDGPAEDAGSIRGRPLSRALTVLLFAAAATITLGGMKSIADILGPLFLALVLTISLHPMRAWLETRRLPEWAASIVMLVCVYVLLAVLALMLVVSVAQLATLIPQYADQMDDKVANLVGGLKDLGVKQDQIDAVAGAFDPGQLVDLLFGLLTGVLGVLSNLLFLFILLLFITFDTNGTRRGLAAVGDRMAGPVAALGSFAQGARTYMVVSAVFGLIVATIDGVVLYLMGVPGAFAWAVLAFVTNFIPNIGFVIGVIPPALIALLDDGVGKMVAVILVYSVINFVIQSIIQPRVVGDAVGLSTTLTFVSLVFWTWIMGPLGAILAVPLSLLTRAILVEADPSTRWILPLISGKPPPAAEVDEQVHVGPPG